MQRYLQTLNSISAENNSTIVFPVPIDIISQLVSVDTADTGPEPEQRSLSRHTLIDIETETDKNK